jgi:hypothetical protein
MVLLMILLELIIVVTKKVNGSVGEKLNMIKRTHLSMYAEDLL